MEEKDYKQMIRDAFLNYEALEKFLNYEVNRIIGRKHYPTQKDPLNLEAQKDWAVLEYINYLKDLCNLVKQRKETPNGRYKTTITTTTEQL